MPALASILCSSRSFSYFLVHCFDFLILKYYGACPELTHFLPVQLQIEEVSRKLRTGELGIPANPEERCDNNARCGLMISFIYLFWTYLSARSIPSPCSSEKHFFIVPSYLFLLYRYLSCHGCFVCVWIGRLNHFS